MIQKSNMRVDGKSDGRAVPTKCPNKRGKREERVPAEELQHTTLATEHLRFLFVVAKIWKHSGLVGISYSDQYAERGLFQRLMKRRRDIATGTGKFLAGARQAADTGACCSVIGVAKHISARKTARNLCAKLALNDGK